MRRGRLAAVAAALVAAGCRSFSDSSESISESVNNVFESVSHSIESSSDSSSPHDHAAAAQNYRRDVGAFTVAWLERDEGDREPGALVREVGRIAELYGVTDWESAPATRQAMRDAALDERVDESARARLLFELRPLGDGFAREVDAPP